MKPVLRKSLPHPEYSFVTRQDVGDHIRTDWHYHPDYELVLIKKSRGTWLVGDYVGYFASGDVILIRPNLPHSRSEEHTSELQSLIRISYAVFCLKKKTKQIHSQ